MEISHEIAIRILDLAGGIVGMGTTAFITMRTYFHYKAHENEAKAAAFRGLVDRFGKEVDRLDAVTRGHANQLVATCERIAEVDGKLQLALPMLNDLLQNQPKFTSALMAMHKDLEAMRLRLKQRDLPGSGGKTVIESTKEEK